MHMHAIMRFPICTWEEQRVTFAIAFLLVVFYIVYRFRLVAKQYYKIKMVKDEYKINFLSLNKCHKFHDKNKKAWIPFLTVIILSYVICAAPWLMNEVREGLQGLRSNPIVHCITLTIYSLNYYFPSLICMYMQYQKRRNPYAKTAVSFHYRASCTHWIVWNVIIIQLYRISSNKPPGVELVF